VPAKPTIPRFSDERLEIVWAAIQTLDPGRLHVVLRELATVYAAAHAQPGRSPLERVRAAVQALHDAASVLGRSPTVPEYRSLRAELPELELPPDGSIRRWLGGGWNACLKRALLSTVTDGVSFRGRTA